MSIFANTGPSRSGFSFSFSASSRTVKRPLPTTRGGSRRRTALNFPPTSVARYTGPESSSSTTTAGDMTRAFRYAARKPSSVSIFTVVCRPPDPSSGFTITGFESELKMPSASFSFRAWPPMATGNPAFPNRRFISALLSIQAIDFCRRASRGIPSNAIVVSPERAMKWRRGRPSILISYISISRRFASSQRAWAVSELRASGAVIFTASPVAVKREATNGAILSISRSEIGTTVSMIPSSGRSVARATESKRAEKRKIPWCAAFMPHSSHGAGLKSEIMIAILRILSPVEGFKKSEGHSQCL